MDHQKILLLIGFLIILYLADLIYTDLCVWIHMMLQLKLSVVYVLFYYVFHWCVFQLFSKFMIGDSYSHEYAATEYQSFVVVPSDEYCSLLIASALKFAQ